MPTRTYEVKFANGVSILVVEKGWLAASKIAAVQAGRVQSTVVGAKIVKW